MNKIISLTLILLICFSITACASDAIYSKINKEITLSCTANQDIYWIIEDESAFEIVQELSSYRSAEDKDTITSTIILNPMCGGTFKVSAQTAAGETLETYNIIILDNIYLQFLRDFINTLKALTQTMLIFGGTING